MHTLTHNSLFDRQDIHFLWQWLAEKKHKPLFLYGMSRVGKTTLVQQFASLCEKKLITIDCSQGSAWYTKLLKTPLDTLITELSQHHTGVLLLDNIQSCPKRLFPKAIELHAKLFARYPQWPIISVGQFFPNSKKNKALMTLLEHFQGYRLCPLRFNDFLRATEQVELVNWIEQWQWGDPVSLTTHAALTRHVELYHQVGGLPTEVQHFMASNCDNQTLPAAIAQHHKKLLSTQLAHCADYSLIHRSLLENVIQQSANNIGKKCQYRRLSDTHSNREVKKAIQALEHAGLVQRCVHSSSAHSSTLDALANPKFFKLYWSDIGMLYSMQPFACQSFESNCLDKQFVAQQLLPIKYHQMNQHSGYYWQRESKNASAQVDFLLPIEHQVIPIVVRSGATGALRGLHQWLLDKGPQDNCHKRVGVRVAADIPKLQQTSTQLCTGQRLDYQLASIPLYLVESLPRLLLSSKLCNNT